MGTITSSAFVVFQSVWYNALGETFHKLFSAVSPSCCAKPSGRPNFSCFAAESPFSNLSFALSLTTILNKIRVVVGACIGWAVQIVRRVLQILEGRDLPSRCGQTSRVHCFAFYCGEPIFDFVACIIARKKYFNYKGGGQCQNWKFGYANCQGHIAEELEREGTLSSSFYKVLKAANGVAVLVIDENSTVVSRIWCCFEKDVKDKSLAMATCVDGLGDVLTKAPASFDLGGDRRRRVAAILQQSDFPAEGVAAAGGTKLELVASNEQDKTMLHDCCQKVAAAVRTDLELAEASNEDQMCERSFAVLTLCAGLEGCEWNHI